MNKRLLNCSLFAIAFGIFFRTFGDMQDGLSWRNSLVGWWSWHVVGWMARDVWQAVFIVYISIKTLMKENIVGKNAVLYIAFNLFVSVVMSFFWHGFIYEWTLKNLKYFNW